MPSTVVIALGSNLGDRRWNLERALREISPVVRIVRRSSVMETEPVDAPPPNYLNMVIAGHTALAPLPLLRELLAIEKRLGRVRPALRNAPRTIDLDLIFYDAVRMQTAELTLPHPRYRQREFVMQPLREIGMERPL